MEEDEILSSKADMEQSEWIENLSDTILNELLNTRA